MRNINYDKGEQDRRRMYDASARLYAATFPLIWRYGFRRLHGWMSDQFAGTTSILDAGTGPGYWASYLASVEPRQRVVGLDFSEEFLKIARQKHSSDEIEFVHGDLTATDFDDASFDGILCSGVLDTFPDPTVAFDEFRRLLQPHGRVVLILRGKGSRTSKALERFFRACVGVSQALRARSVREFNVSDGVWNRGSIYHRLPTLAESSGLAVVGIDASALMARAVLAIGDDG